MYLAAPAGRKSQKLCGAPEQGVRGKTVEWNSPLGGDDGLEVSHVAGP
jgi:hypothetical protein